MQRNNLRQESMLIKYPHSMSAEIHIEHDETVKRCIHRLCKHFSHKVTVEWSSNNGFIEFSMGSCTLSAIYQGLRIHCEAVSPLELDDIVDTINRHFTQFSGGIDLSPHWK